MNKPKSLTQMFNERVGIVPATKNIPTDDQDIKEYLTEREGIHIDSGMSLGQAIGEARKDLHRLQGEQQSVKPFELDL